jgi:hypothetical protein
MLTLSYDSFAHSLTTFSVLNLKEKTRARAQEHSLSSTSARLSCWHPGRLTIGSTLGLKGESMRKILALLLCFLFPLSVLAGDNSYKIVYDGGSLPDIKAGNDMKLFIDGSNIRIKKGDKEITTIPAAAITEVSYGQDVHRRVGAAIGVAVISLGIGALLALSKSKKHFVGLTWDDGGKKGGFAFQADKNDYRGLLAGLEGVTGKKAVDSDAMNVKN